MQFVVRNVAKVELDSNYATVACKNSKKSYTVCPGPLTTMQKKAVTADRYSVLYLSAFKALLGQ